MALSKERLLKVYRDMVMIRRFEEVIEEYAANGTIPGFVHLSIGQEACQAGVVDALKKTDYKFPDHRGHGAIALCGTDPKLVMAEILQRRQESTTDGAAPCMSMTWSAGTWDLTESRAPPW